MNLAIIIGVSKYKYDTYSDLPACKNDAELFKSVLSDVKAFDDILYLNDNQEYHLINKAITSFVNGHKDKNVNELVFYFSGHGERIDNEFYYLCSDFIQAKKGTTGISNTYLDGIIRNLSPKLYVKFVDACYSGTQYIKSESNYERDFKNSAASNHLNNIYFFFSSRGDTESTAGPELSYFSESIFTCILEREHELKYHELMAYVADDLERRGAPTPIFISQATLLEDFGEIKESTHNLINQYMGLQKNADDSVIEKSNSASTLLSLIQTKSSDLCCTKEEALANLDSFNKSLLEEHWPSDITDIFEVNAQNLSKFELPNGKLLGEWLDKNSKLGLFAKPSYTQVKYEIQEYKKLPKKPSRYQNALTSLLAGFESDDQYKLENVMVTKDVIDGVEYSNNDEYDKNIISISFKPKFESIPYFNLTTVLMYSKSKLSIHFSYEVLHATHWDVIPPPQCNNWKNILTPLKSATGIKDAANNIIHETSSWIIERVGVHIEDL